MSGRTLAIPAVLSVAGLLWTGNSAPAQHHGGGGHVGGGHIGGGHMGGGHIGGAHIGGAHIGGMHVGGFQHVAPVHVGGVHIGGVRPPVAYNAGRPTMGNYYNRGYYSGATTHPYVNPAARGPYQLYRGGYYGGYSYPNYYGLYALGGLGLGGYGLGTYAPLYGYAYNTYGGPGMTSYYPASGYPATAGGVAPQQLQLTPGAAPQVQVPAQQQQAQQPAAAPQADEIPADSASLRVLVPVANATILFDGNKTTQTGTERYFHTPPLKEGASASYRIRVLFQQNGKDVVLEQVVPVQAGQNITVDFTRPPNEPLPSPTGK